MNFFGSFSHWILMIVRLIQNGFRREELPELGMSRVDKERRFIAWILFFAIFVPICLFILALAFKPQWFI